MPIVLALWLTLISSNYPSLEHILVFEPFKFYCNCKKDDSQINETFLVVIWLLFDPCVLVLFNVSLINGLQTCIWLYSAKVMFFERYWRQNFGLDLCPIEGRFHCMQIWLKCTNIMKKLHGECHFGETDKQTNHCNVNMGQSVKCHYCGAPL